MKTKIGQRILSLVLVLVMVLGMVPVTLSTRAEAEPAGEQTTAEDLITRINEIETGDRYSKYVHHSVPYTLGSDGIYNMVNGQGFFEGLGGKYIFVNKEPINGAYYAFDPTNPVRYCHYGLDPVTVDGEQLFGADVGTVIELQMDTTAKDSNNNNDWAYWPTSGRARYYMKTVDGRYIHLLDYSGTNTTKGTITNGLQLKPEVQKVSTTILAWPKGIQDGVYIFNSGPYKDSDRTGLLFAEDLTAGTYYIGSNAATSTVFILYKERTDRVNVEPLYDALMEARTYLASPNAYETGRIGAFLTQVDATLSMYNEYNQDSYSDTPSEVEAAQEEVETQLVALEEAMAWVKPYDEQINELLAPVTQQISAVPDIEEGSYFVMALDRNGFYATFDPDAPGEFNADGTNNKNRKVFNKLIYLPVANGNVTTDSLVGSSTFKDFRAHRSIMLSNGQYLNVADNTTTLTNSDANMENILYGTPLMIGIEERSSYGSNDSYNKNLFSNKSKAFLLYNRKQWVGMSNNRNLFHAWTSSDAPTNGGDEYDMYLFRISDLTLELFKALEYMEPYGCGNADGRYDETVYAAFAKDLSEALEKYRTHRSEMTSNTPNLQGELDALAAKLRSHAGRLTAVDSHASYIDIPMELMDFRSDKLLFECLVGATGYRYALTTLRMEEQLKAEGFSTVYNEFTKNAGTINTDTNNSVRQNLTLETLIDGELYYAKHTVDLVAALLVTEWTLDENHELYKENETQINTFNTSLDGKDWQDAFIQKAEDLYKAYHASGATANTKAATLGSFDATVKKTTTGENGGILYWKDVKTAYDLAYYMLNNLWRPVPSEDYLNADNELYNTVITERNTLRLHYDPATGMYTMDAINRVVTDGYTVMNAVPQMNSNLGSAPLMMPADGLGFEKNGTETDPGSFRVGNDGYRYDIQKSNFGYSLHASGSFVYYEGQEQTLSFVGDDDVYFFVNDKLAVDLGGCHSAAGFNNIDLRQLNEEKNLGLVDGGIYSFDMFYAERHTNAANMKFSTNIKIVNPEAVTTKGQYIVQMGGADATDPITGKGSPVADNTGVFIGDIMAYSFDLQNTMDVPLVNVRMEDPTLGVSLSPTYIGTYEGQVDGQTVISLTDPDADHANGVVTRFDNLLLEYRTLDNDNVPASQPVQSLSAGRMLDLLTLTADLPEGAQNWKYTSLPEGCYRVRVENADELRALLKAGIPTKCSFSIYGFLRKVKSTDTPYINELTTHCDYPRSSHTDAAYSTVTGKASRMIRAMENSNMPQVRKLEVVLDYGKAVAIPLEDIVDLVHFEDGSPARVGEVIGFVSEGYNGQPLTKFPAGIFCNNIGDTAPGVQGAFHLDSTELTFTPSRFLDQIEGLFAVIALEDFYYGTETTVKIPYILAQITFTPAHVMYYETDFAPESNIFTLTQAGSFEDVYERENDVYPGWTPVEDDTGSTDPYQDYSRLANTVYGTEIDREGVPSDAFFADFTGDGYDRRYRDNPLYNGLDFDLTGTSTGTNHAKYWVVNTGNANYATIDHTTGTLSFTMKSIGKSAYVQTGISLDNATTTPIYLHPGREDMAQVRFKLKNFKIDSDNNDPWFRLYFSDSSGELQCVQAPFPEAYLNSDQYYTVTIPMTDVYSRLPSVDRLRVQLFNVNSISASAMGVMTIDYIYVGPTAGLPEKLYQNYLLFTFDRSAGDTLRYGSSIYGGTDFSNVGNWSTDIASSPNKKLEIKNGCLTFTDNIDLNGTAGYTYNYFHSGSTDSKTPLAYTPGKKDVCQVRVRVSNGNVISGKTPDLWIEALAPGAVSSNAFKCGMTTFDYSKIKGKFHTFTIPLNESAYLKLSKLASIRPTFHNIQGATFEVDYIYIGPEHMLPYLSQEQDPTIPAPAEVPRDHLFFDFTNKDRDRLRYSNIVYNNPVCNHPDCTVENCQNPDHLLNGRNYDLVGNWSVDFDTSIIGIDTAAGTITFADANATAEYNYIHSAPSYWLNQLNFTRGSKDHLLVRMKITGGSCSSGSLTLSMENYEGTVQKLYGKATFPASDYMDGNYHVFTVPLNMEDYIKTPLIKGVRPVISGTQGCTFTVDYIYVGPLTEGNPVNSSLYFGFGNTGEDQQRYTAISYGEFNYDRWEPGNTSDVANWATGYGPSGTQGRPSGTGGDFSIDNSSGTITVYPPSFVSFDDNEVYRVDLMPAKTSRKYEYSTSTNLPLHYRPDRAGLIQIRLKIENCEDGSGDDKFVNDDGWNEAQGDRYDVPALDVRVNYLKDGVHKVVNPHTYWTSLDLTSPEYRIITIPLEDHIAEADYVDGIDVRFWHIKSKKSSSGEDIGKIVIDYIYMGPGRIAPEPVYGYDSSYLNDTELSNGSSFVVTGQGVKTQFQTDKYTEASFSFRGTGFDIISRTDMDQGSIRIEVWKKGADREKDKPVKTLTVNNKGELELYQIPVASVQGLPFGDYDVILWVSAPAKTSYEFLNHKGNFHFDAVRIYDPMGEDTGLGQEILHTYLVDTEGYASVKEIRNILLSAEDFASQLTGNGAIFVDSAEEPTANVPATDETGETIPDSTTTIVSEGIEVTDHITASATTYNKIGPKNEVYLAPGQAVAFVLKISTEYVPASVDVSAKTIKADEPANLVAGIVTQGNATANGLMQVVGRRDVTVGSATAQYYALPIDADTFFELDGSRYCYIVLYNNGTAGTVTNVLSVTDIKVAYDKQPEIGLPQDAVSDNEIYKPPVKAAEPYYDFVVDSQTLRAAALVMKAALETPLLIEDTKLMHSLNLASDISLNYALTKESMADYDSFYLEVKLPGREEALRIDPIDKGMYYYFTLEGLTAVQMNDVLEATLYMKKDGRLYCSETDHYSIAQYAYAQLNKDGAGERLKTLCADFLRYGAKAQIYKSYRTDALADSAMTASQRAYLSDLEAVSFGNTDRVLTDLDNAPITWAGKALNLESRVGLKFVFDPTNYSGSISDLMLCISYRDGNGNQRSAKIKDPALYNEAKGLYVFTADMLLAAELRSVVAVQIFADNTPLSCTLEYSADTYGNNKTGALLDLCKALFAYSDSAKAYFA